MISTIQAKINSQIMFCDEHNLILFVPEDGICTNCGKQIFSKVDEEEAANHAITSCPNCNYSYVD